VNLPVSLSGISRRGTGLPTNFVILGVFFLHRLLKPRQPKPETGMDFAIRSSIASLYAAAARFKISRRDALFASGALVVGFSLAGALEQATAQAVTKPVALTEVDSFLAIDKSGKVTIYSGKVDLGTGVYTALQQIVADELDVPMNRIELIQGDTLLTPDQGKTWASISIQIGGMQLRQAAAAARAALVEDAAKTLRQPSLRCEIGNLPANAQHQGIVECKQTSCALLDC
jgi:CO/xanthine dehydrogenase Mo-binding subunit